LQDLTVTFQQQGLRLGVDDTVVTVVNLVKSQSDTTLVQGAL